MSDGIVTPLQRQMPREEMMNFGWINQKGEVRDGFKAPEQGASTSVWTAVGRELGGGGGLSLEDCGQAEPFNALFTDRGVMPRAIDPEAADRLWTLSESTTSGYLVR